MATAAERQRKLRQNRLLAGLCITCGKNKSDNNLVRCSYCREKHNNDIKNRKLRRKASGLCGCGRNIIGSYNTCDECRNKAILTHEKAVLKSAQLGKCRRCSNDSNNTYCNNCLHILNTRTKSSRAKLKDLVFSHYGGYKCVCCGETEKLFLTIDHINNDGAAHRKLIGGRAVTSERLHAWLRDNNYPAGFQVLCMNCNFGKHRNGGICPHKMTVDHATIIN